VGLGTHSASRKTTAAAGWNLSCRTQQRREASSKTGTPLCMGWARHCPKGTQPWCRLVRQLFFFVIILRGRRSPLVGGAAFQGGCNGLGPRTQRAAAIDGIHRDGIRLSKLCAAAAVHSSILSLGKAGFIADTWRRVYCGHPIRVLMQQGVPTQNDAGQQCQLQGVQVGTLRADMTVSHSSLRRVRGLTRAVAAPRRRLLITCGVPAPVSRHGYSTAIHKLRRHALAAFGPPALIGSRFVQDGFAPGFSAARFRMGTMGLGLAIPRQRFVIIRLALYVSTQS